MVRVLAVAMMLVSNPAQVDAQINASEPQQAIIISEVVQMVGSEVNEVNEPTVEVPQDGYITINNVVDAWDITIDYGQGAKGENTDEN